MMRALAALACAAALSACGVFGPAQGDFEVAIHDYYVNGVPRPGVPDLRGATVADFEGCQPLRGFYRCPVVFQTATGRVPTLVWLGRDAQGWRVQNVALNVRRP